MIWNSKYRTKTKNERYENKKTRTQKDENLVLQNVQNADLD